MNKKIRMITFDLDDTLWDNVPTITKAEIETRKWIENKVGKIDWGDLNDFLNLREELIKEDESIKWDISKLRKEIFRKKLAHITPEKYRNKIVEDAFTVFISKRHEVKLFDGVEKALRQLSKSFVLGVLTNGNADIFRFGIGKYFSFSVSSLEAKNSKPNRAHFDKAIQIMGDIKIDEILHIGDHQVNDILAAYDLGIESFWFNNNESIWNQNFPKPDEFRSWKRLPEIVNNKYG